MGIIVVLVALSLGSTASSTCLLPLGMKDGRIKDAQISSSSSFEPNSVGSHHGRLRSEAGGGAWCPKGFVSQAADQFLEIDLGSVHRVGGVVTQGRFANGLGQEFAEFFLVQYWRPGMVDYQFYSSSGSSEPSLLTGNTDTFSEAVVHLEPAISASRVRIVPYSSHPRTVCMRVELLGCNLAPKPLALDNPLLSSSYMGIMAGILITLVLLLALVIVLLMRKRDLKRQPSLSCISVSGSVLEQRPGSRADKGNLGPVSRAIGNNLSRTNVCRLGIEDEPVYQEPGQISGTPPLKPVLSADYSTPISVIYCRDGSDYSGYQCPDLLRSSSLTDISYLDESSVDSVSSSGTPRLPPLPAFDKEPALLNLIYVNQSQVARCFDESL